MDRIQKEGLRLLGGAHITFDAPMKPHTTFQVGGTADAFYDCHELKELSAMIAYLSRERIPYFVIGNGSNILVRDSGIRGVVIHLSGALAGIEQKHSDRDTLVAGGGLSIKDLLIRCRDLGLSGLEFMAGIPGSIGGAVAMNAGAFGSEICDRIEGIRLITPQGSIVKRGREALRFSYRGLQLEKGSIIATVSIPLAVASKREISQKMSHCLKWRKQHQPLDYRSAGSVFKNPPNDYAGRLIEAAGLKGKRIAGAVVSNRHANFIVNKGNAKAADILKLMGLVQAEVKCRWGIELEPEIQVVGDVA